LTPHAHDIGCESSAAEGPRTGAPADALRSEFLERMDRAGIGPAMLFNIDMINAGSEKYREAVDGGYGDYPEAFVADIFYAMLKASPLARHI
jgi:hypothetical protein